METIRIENIGDVSRVCLGTWAIGGWMWGGQDDQDSIRAIHSALDKGVNLIDTAPIYGFGRSEKVVGEAIKQASQSRENLALATKVGLEWTDDEKVVRNTTPERLKKELEDSLERLQVDYIDLYQIHWPDKLVAPQEVGKTMKSFLESGKIRAVGLSNFNLQQLQEFEKECPVQSLQPPFNIFERKACEETLEYSKQKKIVNLCYGALCRGLLSGKMTEEREFNEGDLRNVDPKFQPPRFQEYLNAVNELQQYARENYGKDVIHLAIRWILDRGPTVALWGARKEHQMDPINQVWDWRLTSEDFKEIDAIIEKHVDDPVGPGFMAPPYRE